MYLPWNYSGDACACSVHPRRRGISPWVVSAAMLVGKLTNMADLGFTLTSKVGRVEPSRSLCSYDSVLVVLWPACMLRKLGRLDPSRSPSERLHQFLHAVMQPPHTVRIWYTCVLIVKAAAWFFFHALLHIPPYVVVVELSEMALQLL